MPIRSIELHKDAKRVDIDLYNIPTGLRGLIRIHINGLVELDIEGHKIQYTTNIERLIDYIVDSHTTEEDTA